MRTWLFALLVLGATAPAAPTIAQGATGNTLQEWGLLGWWSLRCDLPVSSSNYYYGYVVDPQGRAWHERDLGNPRQNDRSQITAVKLLDDGTIGITIDFKSLGQVRYVVFAKEGGRIRAMYNRGPNNDITVEDGILKHNGRPTPWQDKCR